MNHIDRYVFLASAVAGRSVSLRVSVKNDERTFSDGHSIVVPTQALDASHWPAIVAQAALIAAGSLNAAIIRQLMGRPQMARRYLYLEMLRANRLLQHRLPWSFTQFAELRDMSPLSNSASQSLALACGSMNLADPPEYFGAIRPLPVLRRAINDEGMSSLLRKQSGKFSWRKIAEHSEDEQTDSSAILRLFQNPFASHKPSSNLLNQMLGAGVSKGYREANHNAGDSVEMPVGRIERSLRRGVNMVLARLAFAVPEIDQTAQTQRLTYPEWDTHKQRYQPNRVFVEEAEAWRADGIQDLLHLLQPPPLQLLRQLASLGLDHEMHRRQGEGADLDAGALIDCAIELRTGYSPSTLNIYRASRRTRRDLAVVIVVDISGSTGEHNQFGESIFQKQLQLAYQLGLTLSSLGDTVATFGFHSWGRKLVRVVQLKDYEERWSARVAERLALLEPVGYTRIGTAIRHGSRLLQNKVRLPNRLLLLITDGIAYDQDYEHSYAEGDARKALEEARAMGTACVCLSVGSGAEIDKLAKVFGAANILAVDEVAQITGRVRAMCRQALAAVSRRRWHAASKVS